jgi:peptide deformylase
MTASRFPTSLSGDIKVKYLDSAGKEQVVEASDSLAELLQHEIDHLDGVLAVDRATGLDPFCLRGEWNLRYAEKGRTSRPSLRVPPAVEQLV